MAYVKYILIEQRGFTPRKTPPPNIKNILSQIELFEMYPKIFALVIKDDKLRARVFMRYQEFYESDSETLREIIFLGLFLVMFHVVIPFETFSSKCLGI